jgi:hypothetical protein
MTFQDRVREEGEELEGRLTRLEEFINSSPTFPSLDAAEQCRLRSQRYHMNGYLQVLQERIAAFKDREE